MRWSLEKSLTQERTSLKNKPVSLTLHYLYTTYNTFYTKFNNILHYTTLPFTLPLHYHTTFTLPLHYTTFNTSLLTTHPPLTFYTFFSTSTQPPDYRLQFQQFSLLHASPASHYKLQSLQLHTNTSPVQPVTTVTHKVSSFLLWV